VRLEPLFADLVPALSSDEGFPKPSVSLLVESPFQDFEASPLQLRASSRTRSLRRRVREVSRPSSMPNPLRSCSSCAEREPLTKRAARLWASTSDGGARHRRGARVVMDLAPLRETMARS